MAEEVQLIGDDDGLAVIGAPTAVERFLKSVGRRERARGRSARAKVAAARRLEQLSHRADKVARPIRRRIQKITTG